MTHPWALFERFRVPLPHHVYSQRLLATTALCAAFCCGCVGGAARDETARPVVGGELTAEHEEVGLAVIGSSLCSTVAITPRVMLTAGHCVQFLGGEGDSVYFGTTIRGDEEDPGFLEQIPIVDWVAYDSSNDPDLGLLLLERELSVAPARFNRTPLTNAHVGQPIELIGWGDTALDAKDLGAKREIVTSLAALDRTELIVDSICHGDSGGPLFMDFGAGAVVVAIAVDTSSPVGCSGEGRATQIAPWIDWIDGHLATIQQWTPPRVTIRAPYPGQTVGSTFRVAAEASDNAAVKRVILNIDGDAADQRMEEPFEFDISGLALGGHRIEVVAEDNVGAQSSRTIEVYVAPPCQNDADCTMGDQCVEMLCTQAESDFGQSCLADADCASGHCIDSDERYCTQLCGDGATCPSGYTCQQGEQSASLCMRDNREGGCRSSRSGGAGLWLVVTCVALTLRRGRRTAHASHS